MVTDRRPFSVYAEISESLKKRTQVCGFYMCTF